jgi:dTDP-4-dehydrorhamnose reductase
MAGTMKRPGGFLVVGADSEVGSSVLRHLTLIGRRAVGTTRRKEMLGPDQLWLDLAALDEGWAPPDGTTAACICAARSRLAECAADPSGTSVLNVDQTARLATRLSQLSIYTLFLSSNQVFDGEQPFVAPEVPPCPVSEYGRQKAAAEVQIMAAGNQGGGAGVLRLSRVLGPVTPTTAKWAAAVMRREPINAFADMVLAPVPIEVVAAAVCHLLAEAATGIFQLSGPHDVSYAEFARALAGAMQGHPELVREVSAASAELPPGSTPRHTTLDSTELRDRYGIVPPDAPATARLLACALNG